MQSRRSEVVQVGQREFLVASGRQIAANEIWNGKHLEGGFYFALGPRRARSDQRVSQMRYFGPFPSRVQAQFLALSALAIGLLDPVPAERKPAAPRPALRSWQSSYASTSP